MSNLFFNENNYMTKIKFSMTQFIIANIIFSFSGAIIGSTWFFLFSTPSIKPLASNFKNYHNDINGKLVGIGEYKLGKWNEYITFKKKSRLHDREGDSAIVIHNIQEPRKTFELGFYNYGPTLATSNEIVEFFIGDVREGAEYSALSLRPLQAPFGGSLQVRNHADTSAIFINNHKPNSTNFHTTLKKIMNNNSSKFKNESLVKTAPKDFTLK